MSLLLIWYNNCPFWVGGRERDGSECMALSSAAKIWSLIKYLLILAFAFGVFCITYYCSLVPKTTSLFPIIGLKTKERLIKMQLLWSSWKCHILNSRGVIVSFLKWGRHHSSAAEPQIIHCNVPCLTPDGLNGLLRLTESCQMLAE